PALEPRSGDDSQLAGSAYAGSAGVDIVIVTLDAVQNAAVDLHHDGKGRAARAVNERGQSGGLLIVGLRTLHLEPHQFTKAVGQPSGSQVFFRDAEPPQILLRKIDPVALRVFAHIA